jgi:hypothetical protein
MEKGLNHMKTAEKYHNNFMKRKYFEKLLPYTIIFGLTKEWIKKMEQIYGSDYLIITTRWYSGVEQGSLTLALLPVRFLL